MALSELYRRCAGWELMQEVPCVSGQDERRDPAQAKSNTSGKEDDCPGPDGIRDQVTGLPIFQAGEGHPATQEADEQPCRPRQVREQDDVLTQGRRLVGVKPIR
jgi:hypothetical protein